MTEPRTDNKVPVRVVMPHHLRTLASVEGEIELEVATPITTRNILDSLEQRYTIFFEADVEKLLARLACADLVVGFNVRRFDYQVLRGYTDDDLSSLPTFDLLDEIHARLGFRVSLAHLGEETLGESKSADGLQALEWWKQGRLDEIEEYCRRDVALLRHLFEHACEHGHLLFLDRGRDGTDRTVRIPVEW